MFLENARFEQLAISLDTPVSALLSQARHLEVRGEARHIELRDSKACIPQPLTLACSPEGHGTSPKVAGSQAAWRCPVSCPTYFSVRRSRLLFPRSQCAVS